MGVSDLIEKVDLVFRKEERDSHRVYRCVAPSLSKEKNGRKASAGSCAGNVRIDRTHLVIESPSAFEVIDISGVRFTSPKLHVRDFHVTPIYRVSATSGSHYHRKGPSQ